MDNLVNEMKGLRYNGRRYHLALFGPYERHEVNSVEESVEVVKKKKKTFCTMTRQDFKGSQLSSIRNSGKSGVSCRTVWS